MNQRTPQSLFLISLVLLVIGLASLQTSLRSKRLLAKGIEGQAEIVDTFSKRKGTSSSRTTRYYARLAIEGTAGIHTNSISKGTWRNLSVGQKVRVFYEPAKPSHFVIGGREQAESQAGLARFILPLGGLLVLGGLTSGALGLRGIA